MTAPSLAILGAGRLGSAIAARWCSMRGARPPLWSRRFAGAPADRGDAPFVATTIEAVMAADTVVVAIPSRAFAELAPQHRAVSAFAGALLFTGIDLPGSALRALAPSALVARVVPALLAAPHSIPSLVLDPGHAGERWRRARAVLEQLGPIRAIEDEAAFETIMYLTSPFPVVLRRALAATLSDVLAAAGVDPTWMPVAEETLWTALAAMAPAVTHETSVEAGVVTPGGVTAAGLETVPDVARALVETLRRMMSHAR